MAVAVTIDEATARYDRVAAAAVSVAAVDGTTDSIITGIGIADTDPAEDLIVVGTQIAIVAGSTIRHRGVLTSANGIAGIAGVGVAVVAFQG